MTAAAGTSLRLELILLGACFLFGLTALPVLVYFVGQAVFGEFDGGGLGSFFADVHLAFWRLSPLAWFLVLSPYLVIQLLRMTIRFFRSLAPR